MEKEEQPGKLTVKELKKKAAAGNAAADQAA